MKTIILKSSDDFPKLVKGGSLVHKNKRCFIYFYQKKGIYLKYFHSDLNQLHSEFLVSLLSRKKFRLKFVPHLISLIFRQDLEKLVLVGYVMLAGKTLSRGEMMDYFDQQRKMWLKGMEKYRFFHNDLKTSNLIYADGKIGLIDLESLQMIKPSDLVMSTKNVSAKINLFGLKWYYDHLSKLQKS